MGMRLAGYELPETKAGPGAPGSFVRATDPNLPARYQANRGDAAWQRAMRLGAEARRGNPRLN